MNPKRLFICMFAILILAGCSDGYSGDKRSEDSGRTINLRKRVALTDSEQQTLNRAIVQFFNMCHPLKHDYFDDIEYVEFVSELTCDENSYFDYRCKKFGWSRMFYLQLKIKDDARLIPSDLHAWGHTEHIYIGGPSAPGFTITKFPQLCGAKRSNGEEAFISSPEMAKLF